MKRLLFLAVLACAPCPAATAPAYPEIAWPDLLTVSVRGEGDARRVIFVPSLGALAHHVVSIRGWITPINLGDGEKITSFLLTGTPGTCPFCLGLGPEGFVLVRMAAPIPADPSTPLHLIGRFEMSATDPSGFFYRLNDGQLVSGE